MDVNNLFDSAKTSRTNGRPNPYRFLGLLFVVAGLSYIIISRRWYYTPNQITEYFLEHRRCEPGVYRTLSQLEYSTWFPASEPGLALPLYWTQPIDQPDPRIEHVVIVQHGNNRNGNDYFCGAVNSLLETNSSIEYLRSHLIIGTQFLIDGDICWDPFSKQTLTVNAAQGITCSYPVWTSEGWKDGHVSVNNDQLNTARLSNLTYHPFHSYDVFNLLIEELCNRTLFPNLKLISLFGFSAGGQTVLRYSLWPHLRRHHLVNTLVTDNIKHNASISIQYVVADISSYLYFDNRRPFNNGSVGYGIPGPDWLNNSWKVGADGKKWISGWNGSCAMYDDWRYGLNKLAGYYDYHSKQIPNFKADLIEAFPGRDLHFLIGLNDSLNCKLNTFPGCNDNDLATYCQAMLQGNNRLDRFEKWKNYLEIYFHLNNTIDYIYVKDISHDPVAMLRSSEAKCLLFKHCSDKSKLDFDLGADKKRLRWSDS
eukprot:gene9981-11039_t